MRRCGRAAACLAFAFPIFSGAVVPPARADVQPRAAPKTVPFDVNDPAVKAEAQKLARRPPAPPPPGHQLRDDRSGRRQSGKASIYSPGLQGQRMANGRRLDHSGQAAASKTLPLGTVAKVTNVRTGRTAVVTVEDRGPFVDGWTMDLTKATADKIGLDTREGVAPVVVAPIAVPQPDGTVKPGAGALPGPATGAAGGPATTSATEAFSNGR